MDAAQLHKAMIVATTRRDFTRLRELFHPECTLRTPEGQEISGPAASAVWAARYVAVFSDLTICVEHLYAASDSVSVLEFTVSGTHDGPVPGIPPTGNTVESSICNIIEAKDGKIYRQREYSDNLTLVRQLGSLLTSQLTMQAGGHAPVPEDEHQLRQRALAKWLLSARTAKRSFPGPEDATCELRESGGNLYAVITTGDGEILARYLAVARGGRWYLYPPRSSHRR